MKIFLLLVFWSLWFCNFSSRTVMSPIMPIIEDQLTINHAQAGSLFFFLSIGHVTTGLLCGFLASHIGYKRVVILSFLIMLTALFCFQYVETYASFLAAFLLMGIGSGSYMPSAIPLLTSTFARENWGKAISFHETAASFSIITIPILTAFALRFFHWSTLLVILSGICLMVTITFWSFAPTSRPSEEKKPALFAILRRKDFWIMATFWTFAAMTTSGLFNILPLFLVKERGMLVETANTLLGISRVGGLFVTISMGFFLDRYRVNKILNVILFVTGLSTAAIGVLQDIWPLMAVLLIHGTIGLGFFPVGILAISKLTEPNERSLFTGATFFIAAAFGLGITPLLLGVVADAMNFQTGIFVLGVLTCVSCLLFRGFKEI